MNAPLPAMSSNADTRDRGEQPARRPPGGPSDEDHTDDEDRLRGAHHRQWSERMPVADLRDEHAQRAEADAGDEGELDP